MASCTYSTEHIYVQGNVYVTKIAKRVRMDAYGSVMSSYDIINTLKYTRIHGDLYIYDGEITARGSIVALESYSTPSETDFIHQGDLVIVGDLLIGSISALLDIHSWYKIPIDKIRGAKINEIFDER